MNQSIMLEQESLFSVGGVEEELDRIFHDPHFTESAILRKFLSFIVQETIYGRSNQLKEYTIAVNVLDKPLDFNPQENCIVRIHAGRLRRALSQYYETRGHEDQLVITIPKGKYIPVFTNRANLIVTNAMVQDVPSLETALSMAIIPFVCTTNDKHIQNFADGLGMHLSSLLMDLHIPIISHQAIRNQASQKPDFKELRIAFGFSHMITGGVEYIKDTMRINFQLIECGAFTQLWSQSYERKLTRSNHFEVQDELCQVIYNKVAGMVNTRSWEQLS